MFVFIYLIILLVSLFFIQYSKKLFYFSKYGLSGPAPLPFINVPIDNFFTDPTKIHLNRRKKYGKIYGLFLGNRPVIYISCPKMAKTITQKEANNFTDARIMKIKIKYITDNFIFKKGEEWRKGRSLLSPIFTTSRIKSIFPTIQKATQPLIENIRIEIEDGKQNEIDIKDLLKGYTLDVIARFVFALELNSVKDKDHPFVQTVRNMAKSKGGMSLKALLITILPVKVSKFFRLELLDNNAIENAANMIRILLKERKNKKDKKFNDLIDMLLETIEEKNLNVDEEEIIGICLIFFSAGMDTVSTCISNILYFLVLHPNYQEQLYKNLINLYSNKEVNYDNLNDSKLLDAVIKESQRLIPIASTIFRIAENPINIDGFKLDANQAVAIDIHSLHNSEDFWNESDKFMPERFLNEDFNFDNVIDNKNSLIYLPFGAGPRSCLATRFGIVQVKLTIIKILLEYKVYRTEKTSVPPKYLNNVQQLVYNSMILGFKKRNN